MTTTVGKIYNEKCVFCVEMAPAWEKMKLLLDKEIKGGTIEIKDFETNIDANQLETFKKKVKESYNQELKSDGVPTIYKISGGGKLDYYEKERTAEAMAKWALNKKGGYRSNKQSQKSQKSKQLKKRTYKKTTHKNRTRNVWKWF
jgi:hypothetical protein